MSSRTMASFALICFLANGTSHAQNAGRFEDSKRLGLQYAASGKYDRAAAKFEEIWDQDQTDPMVAEYLSISYLNGDDRKDHPELQRKAFDLMEKSISLGGKATLLVHHSHEKLGWLQGENAERLLYRQTFRHAGPPFVHRRGSWLGKRRSLFQPDPIRSENHRAFR